MLKLLGWNQPDTVVSDYERKKIKFHLARTNR